ncbi:MAG: DUF2169 domain-containing protein, partial [Minicystis sp.]
IKASFSMLAGPPMTPAPAPDPFRTSDAHHRGQPLAHVIAANDRVPWKGAIDLTLLGTAHAPGGRPLTEMFARLSLRQGGRVSLDKAVRVVGDRRAKVPVSQPFTTMPIVYSRAHGGLGVSENPIGCSEDDDESPNILDPQSPLRATGFGPISAAWAARSKRFGDRPRRLLDAPIIELPTGFDWGYFQSAPPDQLLAELAPDAALLLEGFHPERARIEIALPGARAVGAVYGLDEQHPEAPTALTFRADTLHLDTDRWIATVTFRACTDLHDEALLGRVLVAAGVGLGGQAPAIPATRPGPGQRSAPLAAAAKGGLQSTPTGTIAVGDTGGSLRVTLPFGSQAAEDPSNQTMVLDDPSAPDHAFTAAPPFAAPLLREAASLYRNDRDDAPLTPLPVTHPASPPPKASDFFHDAARLRGFAEPAPPVVEAPAPPKDRAPEEEIDLERHARISALLSAPGASLDGVLEGEAVEAKIWRKADLHWRKALEQEARRGRQVLRDRFDDAYVDAWDQVQPSRFKLWHYACIKQAETDGQLHNELAEQGLDAALGMRLRRVWKRRVAADRALGEELERTLALVRER